MNKLLIGKKLKLKLVFAVLFSLLIFVGSFLVLESASESIINNYISKSTFVEKRQQDALDRFSTFVRDEHISTGDHERLSAWIRKERYLNLYLFVDKKLIYSSNNTELTPAMNEQLLTQLIPSKIPIITISFVDQNAEVYLVGYYEYQYYNLILLLCFSVAGILFVGSFLFMINKKTSYIGVLEREIKILEGGNLDYSITVSGNDELSSLAQSINEMRQSFRDRLGSEENIRQANRELITTISHDLRTPLTILLGYMDIIQLNKYKTQEDLLQYIHNSREKAYQIKALTDKLFEYFTVASNSEEEEIEFETYEACALMDQLIEEQLFVLSNMDFDFEMDTKPEEGWLEVNLVSIRRVFDNIFSNIQKYANPSQPIKISYYMEQSMFHLLVQNAVKKVDKKNDSNEIGLVSCQKMIQQLNGTLNVVNDEELFTLHITLPIIMKK
ncbi:signal transduction histidine kinase [Paenibacillus turicensis]|uniref:histidine kinase n=1 Tax=Paenibacillus turicensis TaxID=160487 RepID=A0ABS4FMI7_9BACL|nr:HAMP domain-containing sensor histidine kinase [Paenibacillus turicensis]MBP1903797.1 signal transduction histidine kinase [Paenibacillus turicensis]